MTRILRGCPLEAEARRRGPILRVFGVLLGLTALLISTSCTGIGRNGHSISSPTRGLTFDDANRQVNVPVMIEGQGPFWVIVDTGATVGLLLDPSVVERLGLTPTGSVQVGDGSGVNDRSLPLTEISSLTVGGLELGPLEVVVSDAQRELGRSGESRVGILGLAAFSSVPVAIDYPRQVVELGSDALASSSTAGDLSFSPGGDLEVPVRIGGLEITAVVDTGSGSTLNLPRRVLDQIAMHTPPQVVATARTRTNSYDVLSGVPKEPVWIAGHRFDRLPVYFNEHHDVAIVGAGVLRSFRLGLDAPRSRAWLEESAVGRGSAVSYHRTVGPVLVGSDGGGLEMVISGSGGPTVVLESGFSDTYEYWNAVESALAGNHTVVRYNRVGFGASKLNDKPRSASQIALELEDALKNAAVPRPYVLVGHSAGALFVREFAHQFPEEVAALVLVDPATQSFYDSLAREDPALWEALVEDLETGPPGAKAQMDVLASTLEQVAAAWPLPEVPVVVVTAMAEQPPVFTVERRRALNAEHRALVERIPGARLLVADGCGHSLPVECPALVTEAVFGTLTELQGNRRKPQERRRKELQHEEP